MTPTSSAVSTASLTGPDFWQVEGTSKPRPVRHTATCPSEWHLSATARGLGRTHLGCLTSAPSSGQASGTAVLPGFPIWSGIVPGARRARKQDDPGSGEEGPFGNFNDTGRAASTSARLWLRLRTQIECLQQSPPCTLAAAARSAQHHRGIARLRGCSICLKKSAATHALLITAPKCSIPISSHFHPLYSPLHHDHAWHTFHIPSRPLHAGAVLTNGLLVQPHCSLS